MSPMLLALVMGCLTATSAAAPFVPRDDSVVVERLPFKANDPQAREVRALRAQLAAKPNDLHIAARLVERYYEMVSAEGDPRYIGYAQAALAPWWNDPHAPVEALVLRATLKQYRHDFAPALEDLQAALAQDPEDLDALSLTATIHMVQGRYAEARAACEKLDRATRQIIGRGCLAMIYALQGRAQPAYQGLAAALADKETSVTTEQELWVRVRLGEFAERLGDVRLAESQYRQALALGITDGYLLAAYSDLLLDQKRPAEVLTLLKGMNRSDLLLLRLALAAKAAGSPEQAALDADLASRFDAARLRGDKVHQAEEARFQLHLMNRPDLALPLAVENWAVQRETRDARILLESAIAAGKPEAAKPVLEWLAANQLENPTLRRLAQQIEARK